MSLKHRYSQYLLLLIIVFLIILFVLDQSSLFAETQVGEESHSPESLLLPGNDSSVTSEPQPSTSFPYPPSDYGDSYRNRVDENTFKYIVPKGPSPPGEKYIAYLPHNQFNNQRIALENAILLAHYTNRTLILPYVYLGRFNQWRRFNELYLQNIKHNTKEHLGHCAEYIGLSKKPPECHKYDKWTIMPWDHLFGDLPNFFESEGIKVISTMNISIEWIMSRTGVNREDFHYFKDGVYYGAKIYDNPSSKTPRGRYRGRLELSEFMEIPHRVVYFESIYGIGRITHELDENRKFFARMVKAMTVTYQGVLPAANKIIENLGGRQNYIGIHVRVSDGFFSRNRDENIKKIVEKIKEDRSFSKEGGESTFLSSEECLANYTASTEKPLIYMATDLRNTRYNSLYSPLYDAFPCITVLDDFAPLLSDLDSIINDVDKMPMKKFLIPLVDLVVAAKGKSFVGTPRSTFSNFAYKLHKIYIDGLPILEDSKDYAG